MPRGRFCELFEMFRNDFKLFLVQNHSEVMTEFQARIVQNTQLRLRSNTVAKPPAEMPDELYMDRVLQKAKIAFDVESEKISKCIPNLLLPIESQSLAGNHSNALRRKRTAVSRRVASKRVKTTRVSRWSHVRTRLIFAMNPDLSRASLVRILS